MPDIELFNELQEDMPSFNQEIMDGLAYTGLEKAKEEVDLLIRCAEGSYPDGFEFLGSVVCSPQEAYSVMASSLTRSDRSTPSVDLAPSDVFLVKYRFAADGKELYPRYFYLPYVRKGGLIMIAGKQFSISPILTDPCFSVGPDNVFIRMSRAPVTFKRVINTVMINGEQVSKYVAYSWLHHRGGNNNKKSESDTLSLGRVMTTLPHYLFCKYGMEEAFKRFAHTSYKLEIVDIPLDDRKDRYQLTLNELENRGYDLKKWEVIMSNHVRPSTLKTRGDYNVMATPIVMLIPKKNLNVLATLFATAFFYIVDHYPTFHDCEELNDSFRWKIWLGYVLWGDQLGWSKLVENVDSHLASLDDYVDIEVKRMLIEEEELDIDNIYQLFVYILQEMDDLIDKKEEDIGSMYGKRLVTAPYVLRDIFEQIFRCLFEITNNKKRKHTADDYNKILGKYFMPTIIFNLRKTSSKPYMSSVSTPGDNMLFKITSRLVMQAQTSAGRKSSNINVNDPLSRLHPSIAEAGNHLVLPKHSPLGRNTLNVTARLDVKKTIQRKEHMVEVIEHIDEAIHRS